MNDIYTVLLFRINSLIIQTYHLLSAERMPITCSKRTVGIVLGGGRARSRHSLNKRIG